MPQVQKVAIRDAILEGAADQFKQNGYSDTSMSQIAAAAGVSTANIYRYFRSKLEVFLAIYEPWLYERLTRLQREAAKMRDPRKRIERVLYVLWRDLPRANNNFANNFMQALSSAKLDEGYTREPFNHALEAVAEMLVPAADATAERRSRARAAAHLLLMAFDGFVMNYRLNGTPRELDDIVKLVADMLDPLLADGRP